MAENELIFIGMGVVFGGIFTIFGIFLLVFGLMNAWTLFRTVFGSETTIGDIDAESEMTWIKLEGTISSVPRPVETLDGQTAGIYRVRALLKNRWNALKKNRQVRQVLTDASDLDGVVLRDDRGETCLLSVDGTEGKQWGRPQSAKNNSFMSVRQDFVSDEWRSERAYSDDQVPRDVRNALATRYGADTDFDTSSFGVGLKLSEDVVEAGDRVHVIGAVKPQTVTKGDIEESGGIGADRSALNINLTPFATVTDGSWRTLAWDIAKRVLLRVPFGAGLVIAGIFLAVQLFQRAGLI